MPPSDFVPAIVVGSGFGGAVAALRLGQAGIDTVVLERGRSLDHNYLPQAEATGHVEILPLHTAIAIEQGAGGRYAVTLATLSDDGDIVGVPRRLACKYLFLAAGSIGTTSLLVRARATKALPALNDHVGQH